MLQHVLKEKHMVIALIISIAGALIIFPLHEETNTAQNYFHEALAYEAKGDTGPAIPSL
jgi:hypothetical protein